MNMRALLPSTAVCLISLLLGACHTLVRESVPGDWIEIPAGSALRLHQPVQIPPGRTRAFFTAGRASGASQDATCALEVRRLDPAAIQTVAPARFAITRVQDYVALVSKADRPPDEDRHVRFQLASHGDSGGAPMIRFGYHFWLDERQDPNVMRLTCLGRHDEPASTRPPTLVEIQAVLGDQATLERAGAAAVPEPTRAAPAGCRTCQPAPS